jgi:hypothetical protein
MMMMMRVFLLGVFLLCGCVFSARSGGGGVVIDDRAGGYAGKVPGLLRQAERLTGKRFKGRKVVIREPLMSVGSVSALMAKLKRTGESEGTIAWTAYDEGSGTAFIQPVIARPPGWAMLHEVGHAVLMSHGIDGHPQRYADAFKYW